MANSKEVTCTEVITPITYSLTEYYSHLSNLCAAATL